MRQWLLFALGVPVGWFVAAVLLPVLIVGSLALLMLHGFDRLRRAMERMGADLTEGIRAAAEP